MVRISFDQKKLAQCIGSIDKEELGVFYDTYQLDFMRYCGWLKNSLKVKHQFHIKKLNSSYTKLKELEEKKFAVCVLFVRLDDLHKIKTSMDIIKKLVKRDGRVHVVVVNERNHYSSWVYDFRGEFAHKMNFIASTPFTIKKVETIHNSFSMLGTMAIDRINKIFSYSKKTRFLFYILVGIFGSSICFIRNNLCKIINKQSGHCTSIILTMVPEDSEA